MFGLAVFLPTLIHKKLDEGINDALILSPQAQQDATEGWRTWQDPTDPDSIPVYYAVHMYNVTNPEQIVNGALANIQEKGPYVNYQQYIA